MPMTHTDEQLQMRWLLDELRHAPFPRHESELDGRSFSRYFQWERGWEIKIANLAAQEARLVVKRDGYFYLLP